MTFFLRHSLLVITLLTCCALTQLALAQQAYTITGRVTDAATGEGIPFASLALKGTLVGTTSNAEGQYKFQTTQFADSIQVFSLGYQTRVYRLLAIASQTVDVQLVAAATKLQEVKIYAKKGDPAYRIIREVVRKRAAYDPSQLSAFQYDSYTKIEGYLNNFDQKRPNGTTPRPY